MRQNISVILSMERQWKSTTYKFAKCLQKQSGIIPGVTDKNYITNSYHVHVTEKIDTKRFRR